MPAHLGAKCAGIKPPQRNGRRTSSSFNGLWIKFGKGSLKQRHGRGRHVVHLLAFTFFAGILVGLAVLLQHMLRSEWQDMVAAFLGRPMPSRTRKPAAATVSVPRSRRLRRAAA
jgi:hypothetical protein